MTTPGEDRPANDRDDDKGDRRLYGRNAKAVSRHGDKHVARTQRRLRARAREVEAKLFKERLSGEKPSPPDTIPEISGIVGA